MTLAKLNCKRIILVDEKNSELIDGVFDGTNYYFLEKSKPIIKKYKKNLQEFIKINTKRKYKNICYDYMENCFWACTFEEKNIIFKINKRFQEIGQIRINACIDLDISIISLSYNREDDSLIATTNSRIIQVSKSGEVITNIYESKYKQCNYYCAKINNCILYLSKIDKNSYIGLNDKWNNKKIFRLPNVFSYTSIVSIKRNSKKISVLLLVKDLNCKNYIISINIYVGDIKTLDDCILHYRNSLDEVLKSITFVENGLGNVINNESEKIKKAIKIANSTEELIEIDNEVNKTIINVTSLENILYSKFLEVEQIQDKLINKIYNGEI